MSIIDQLTAQGIMVLSIYDSFIVAERYRELLERTMRQTFIDVARRRFGCSVPLTVKIKAT
jgi:hypothetical protein